MVAVVLVGTVVGIVVSEILSSDVVQMKLPATRHRRHPRAWVLQHFVVEHRRSEMEWSAAVVQAASMDNISCLVEVVVLNVENFGWNSQQDVPCPVLCCCDCHQTAEASIATTKTTSTALKLTLHFVMNS